MDRTRPRAPAGTGPPAGTAIRRMIGWISAVIVGGYRDGVIGILRIRSRTVRGVSYSRDTHLLTLPVSSAVAGFLRVARHIHIYRRHGNAVGRLCSIYIYAGDVGMRRHDCIDATFSATQGSTCTAQCTVVLSPCAGRQVTWPWALSRLPLVRVRGVNDVVQRSTVTAHHAEKQTPYCDANGNSRFGATDYASFIHLQLLLTRSVCGLPH